MEASNIDVVCIGEGEYTVLNIIDGKQFSDIKGVAFKNKNGCHISENTEFIKDLDCLPFPARNLFDLKRYKTSKLIARKNPAGWIETSRGCPYGCHKRFV